MVSLNGNSSSKNQGVHGIFQRLIELRDKWGDNVKSHAMSASTDNLMVCACFIEQNTHIFEDVNATGSAVIKHGVKHGFVKFVECLSRITSMQEGLSRQDRIFMKQYWRAYQSEALPV